MQGGFVSNWCCVLNECCQGHCHGHSVLLFQLAIDIAAASTATGLGTATATVCSGSILWVAAAAGFAERVLLLLVLLLLLLPYCLPLLMLLVPFHPTLRREHHNHKKTFSWCLHTYNKLGTAQQQVTLDSDRNAGNSLNGVPSNP